MTQQVHNTVFISYRRSVSSYLARAIYMDLKQHGYDVFMDVQSIDSGQFDQVILRQIEARAHFLILCTPGTFDRINDPDDWLRREIEHAILHQRNIVPILASDFKFDAATTQRFTGKLSELPRYNALNAPHDYFEEALERLRSRFLKLPVGVSLAATPTADVPAVVAKQVEVESQPKPSQKQLTAEEYFSSGNARYDKRDYDSAIADYNEALRLNPQYAEAYNNRGNARLAQNNLDGAMTDYNEALRLNPKYTYAHVNRGRARRIMGNLDAAIADYNEALRLNPQHAVAYNNRGYAKVFKGDLDGAILDANKCIELNKSYAAVYDTRAEAYARKGNYVEAIADFEKYLELGGGEQEGRTNEVEEKIYELKRKLGVK